MTPRAEDLAAKFSRVRHAVDQIRSRVDIGGVSVEADGDGKLATVAFSAETLALGPNALADLVMRAYQQASEEAGARANDLLTELYDDSTVTRLAAMTDSELAADCPTSPPPIAQPTYAAAPPAQRPVPTAPPTSGMPPPTENQWSPASGLANTVTRARAARKQAEEAALREQAREWDGQQENRNHKYW